MGLTAVLFVVLALAIVALAVAAWAAGYSRGVEDTARPMAEWYRHHMGDSKAICGNESRTTDKYSCGTETRRYLPERHEAAWNEREYAVGKIAELEAENAKLRELAVLNWEWAHSCCGNNCKMQTDGCGYQIDRECNYEREIYDRMHELGMSAG